MSFDWLDDNMFDHANNSISHDNFNHNININAPNGSLLESHNFCGNNIFHKDDHGIVDGYSTKFGNSFYNHDSHGNVESISTKFGNEIITKDSHGDIIERQEKFGNSTIFKDAHGNVIGHSNNIGQRFDNFGKLISTKTKY